MARVRVTHVAWRAQFCTARAIDGTTTILIGNNLKPTDFDVTVKIKYINLKHTDLHVIPAKPVSPERVCWFPPSPTQVLSSVTVMVLVFFLGWTSTSPIKIL